MKVWELGAGWKNTQWEVNQLVDAVRSTVVLSAWILGIYTLFIFNVKEDLPLEIRNAYQNNEVGRLT